MPNFWSDIFISRIMFVETMLRLVAGTSITANHKRDNLPHRLMLQVELPGGQAAPEEPVLNMERIRRGLGASHLGHFISLSLSFIPRRSSNLVLQAGHSYS